MSEAWKAQANQLAGVCVSTFGDTAIYMPQAATEGTVMEIVFREPVEEEINAPGRYTIGFARDTDFPMPPLVGDTVFYRGRSYYVVRIDSDGQRGIDLMLREEG